MNRAYLIFLYFSFQLSYYTTKYLLHYVGFSPNAPDATMDLDHFINLNIHFKCSRYGQNASEIVTMELIGEARGLRTCSLVCRSSKTTMKRC